MSVKGMSACCSLSPCTMPPSGQRHDEQQDARRGSPEMRAHEFGERKLAPHELRHDVIDGSEHHHREEAIGIQQLPGDGEPGELGDAADFGQRGRRARQARQR